MITGIIIDTGIWVSSPIRQFIIDWVIKLFPFLKDIEINWVAIFFAWVAAGFAIWAIIELCIKLESKPEFVIKAMGTCLLTDISKQAFPREIELYYDVVIGNGSPERPLGIMEIKLQLNHTAFIPPYIGMPASNFGKAEEGTIQGSIYLRANEIKEGKLAFVYTLEEGEKLDWDNARIIIRANRKLSYIFPASTKKMIEDANWIRDAKAKK